MASYPVIRIKPERDWPLRNHHHAIYKTAVGKMPEIKNGSIAEVRSDMGDFLCYAMINIHAYICGRAIAFEEKEDPMISLRRTIERAVALRRALITKEDTDAVRLINAEGDGVPGLIVDQYGDILVLQFTTLGMDKLREWVADLLWGLCSPKGIYEKSTSAARKNERIDPVEGWIRRPAEEKDIIITERGLKYEIHLEGSQKTGLFIDQREMRSLVRSLSKGKTVLDCCSYVGGFSLNALAGGALAADAVDYDEKAIAQAKKHMEMNGVDMTKFGSYAADVFDFLRRKPMPRLYDFVILDPPAFAKRSTDLDQAKKAYTDINRMAMELLPSGGLLLTCSCSFQVDPALFQTIVFHAARQAKRSVRILQRHRMAYDHPVNLYHPEVDYLKSLLLWIE